MRKKHYFKKAAASFLAVSLILGMTALPAFADGSSKAVGTLPGARSEYNSETGDVFLGGNYIEVGVSKGGSFGTSTAPTNASFHPKDGAKRQGLVADGDGWDVGTDSNTGDFFLPGTPEERWIISYKIGTTTYEYLLADRMNVSWPSNSKQQPATVDASDVSKNILKSVTTGITAENIKVEMTYTFGVNDKYYDTIVNVENQGSTDITDVRFVRSFDPDQDVKFNDEFNTYNKVICNPSSDKAGSSDNCAMVVARGNATMEGVFFVSFDNRARASRGVAFAPASAYLPGLWEDKTEGLSNEPTDANLELTSDMVKAGNINGYKLEDDAIAITTVMGTIAAGAKDKTNYYTSLDPNVIDSIGNIIDDNDTPLDEKTDTKIILKAKDGYEYSIDNGETWSDTGIFEGLSPKTEYRILSRLKDAGEGKPGDGKEYKISTKDSGKKADINGVQSRTESTISAKLVEGYEYSIDGGKTWQKSNVFTGLDADTLYTISMRYAETDDMVVGEAVSVEVRTLYNKDSIVNTIPNLSVDLKVNGDLPLVSVSADNIYMAAKNDKITAALAENKNVMIKLNVEKIETVADADRTAIASNLAGDQTLAMYLDMSVDLLIDSVDSKIKELQEPIEVTIDVPADLKMSGREFQIIRSHTDASGNIEVDILDDKDSSDDTITISTDKFSIFAIVYTDKQAAEETTTENVTSPQTGDSANIAWLMAALCVSSFAFVSLRKRAAKRNEA